MLLKIFYVFPRFLVILTIWVRKMLLILGEPIDYVSRIINNKLDLPPLLLRKHVGPLSEFETSGSEFAVYLKVLCELKANEKMLDIGCGCGLLAMNLKNYMNDEGRYVGVDINKPVIKWSQRNVKKGNIFKFQHIDISNGYYRLQGSQNDSKFRFPFDDKKFDFIFLKSVFTHMKMDGIVNYLQEIERMLSDNGRALVTFFVLNDEQAKLKKEGKNKLFFNFGDERTKWVCKNCPEMSIAFHEDDLLDKLKMCKLRLKKPIFYGTWAGRENSLYLQDMLLIEKDI